MSLAARLSYRMSEMKMNQAQLVIAASRPLEPVRQQTISKLMRGETEISRHLPAIAKALRCSLDWLVTGREGELDGSGI